MIARNGRLGFSVIEVVIVAVVVGIVGLLGYAFYTNQAKKAANDTAQTSSQSATASDVKSAPVINHVSDLNTAETVLDQTDPSGTNNTDVNQLNSELANF